ncbi:MAG TPA: DinB family protein [Sporolactobacillaceae bacterium]|nr:DinB family protein [Sporolactobacillaceae bacterium]
MTYSIQMLQMLREYSWDNESWFLPLAPALEGLTSKEAAWQPPGGGNTIWQNVNHINYYNELMVGRIKGLVRKSSILNSDTFGQPGDPNDSAGWLATVEETYRIAGEIKATLDSLTDGDLEKNDLGMKLTAWVTHDSYHTGQIVLLRKMQASWPAVRDE